jgi:hypothetical protein
MLVRIIHNNAWREKILTEIRFGAFQREAHVQQLSISANNLAEV